MRVLLLLLACADGIRLTKIPPDFTLDAVPAEPRGESKEHLDALMDAGRVGLRLYNEQRRSEL